MHFVEVAAEYFITCVELSCTYWAPHQCKSANILPVLLPQFVESHLEGCGGSLGELERAKCIHCGIQAKPGLHCIVDNK